MDTKYKILAASYTRSIFSLSFTSNPSSLKLEASTEVGHHPSWIESLPSTNVANFVTTEEKEDGEAVILSFSDVLKEGKVVDRKQLSARDPCHVGLIPGEKPLVLTANYSSGSVNFIPLSSPRFDKSAKSEVVTLPYNTDPSPKKVMHRQEASHAHQAIYIPEYKEVVVPDLGSDRIWRLAQDSNGWSIQGHIVAEAGDGPRHAVYYGGHLYVVHELSNTLGVHTFPPLSSSEGPQLIQTIASLDNPPSVTAQNAFGQETNAAELLLVPPSPSYPTAILYYSTRNVPGPDGDVITVFTIAQDGKVSKISEIKTGLAHLRALSLSPDHKYLIGAGALGGGAKVFERKGLELVEISQLAYGNGFEKVTGLLWV